MHQLLLQVDASLYTNNVTIIFGVALIALLGIWYYRLQKKNPELDFGPLVATSMVDKHETIFMGIVFLEYIMTALVASTVHMPDSNGIEMSPLGRLGLHIVLSLTGTVAQFTLARDIAVLFIKQSVGEYAGNAFTTIIIILLAMGVPYANLMLIASSVGASLPFQVWIYSISPFTDSQEMLNIYYSLGYPENYQPWENLPPVMHVCIVSAIVVHYGLTIVEALRTISSPKRRKMLLDRVKAEQKIEEEEKEKSSKDDENNDRKKGDAAKSPLPGEKRSLEAVEGNIKFMLRRFGYDGDKLTNKVKELTTAMMSPGDKSASEIEDTQLHFASKLASFVLTAKTIDSKMNGDEKKNKNKALIEDFRKFVEAPKWDGKNLISRDKRGLGIKLKN